jgi:hypothetical protein
MPTLDPITDIQKASTTAAARGVIFVAIVDGRADGDGSGVYAACGGFVSFGEDAGFAVEELLLGVRCHGERVDVWVEMEVVAVVVVTKNTSLPILHRLK